MKKFERGKQYPLRFKSKKWRIFFKYRWAAVIEVVEIEYFDKPMEISERDTESGIFNIGKATIKYIDTEYYKNKLFEVWIVGYFKTDIRKEESSCISLENKFYSSVFLY